MPTTGKPGGLLTNLKNPVAKKPAAAEIVIPPGAEQALGLSERPPAQQEPATLPAGAAIPSQAPAAEPERSKTFFLPYSMCERLELQKLSERREMKHIVRQALTEYFERNPLRAAVRALSGE